MKERWEVILMQFNHVPLKQKLIEQATTVPELAKKIGMKYATLNAKMENRSQFKVEDIVLICQALNIPIKDCWRYFFAEAA
jgi:DNA-binding Xre family transcriptional regulator